MSLPRYELQRSYEISVAIRRKSIPIGEVPVGAVIVNADGNVIATAHNLVESELDATSHAECLVLRKAMRRLGQKYLEKCDLWVTLEPCAMCAGAISNARIRRLYYAVEDKKEVL
ncbi:MAG: hypothetical protein CM15mP117_04740 [Alphaproteobacteria bacterium]|nr:MAG: hypothetical protein CM15mP117_04740 [Alphaproteobacteria bacterium]